MDPHHHRHIDGVSGPSEKLTSEQSAQLDAGLDDFLSFLDEPTPKPVSESGSVQGLPEEGKDEQG